MTLTNSFNHTQLLDTFNQAVCKRMAEEHAFIKTLDEIFQAQGQEIVRYEVEVLTLRRLLSAANTKIAELKPDEVIYDEQQQLPQSPIVQPNAINEVNEYKNECQTEAEIAKPKISRQQNPSDEEFLSVIVPHITIKEELNDDDSDTNPFAESEAMENDDHDMAGTSSSGGNSNQSIDGDGMVTQRIRKSSKKSTFECPFCQQSYSLWSAMKRRVVLDNGQKVFTCRHCKDKHNLVKSSHAYKKSPNHKRPYKCSICHKGFTQASSLACHVRSHTGERPFECKVCSRCFARSDYLKAHMKIHNDEKQHVCSFCSKGFRESRHLRYHLRMHHHQMSDETKIDDMMAAMPSNRMEPEMPSS